MKHAILATTLALASLTSAYAASINGLNNTGLGASGTLDTNYALTVTAGTTVISNTSPYITSASVWPVGSAWLQNSASSKWVTPTINQGDSFDAGSNGVYTYTLSFDLTGYISSTAMFTGRIASDNSVVVKLNSNNLGSSSGFASWSSFSANSGFVSGWNTLEFVVTNSQQNGGNPTGLRVEFLDSNVAPIPEPETYAMLLGGLALMGAVARRRKTK
jgi:hypothetical protein